jgi:hypothetical protein
LFSSKKPLYIDILADDNDSYYHSYITNPLCKNFLN